MNHPDYAPPRVHLAENVAGCFGVFWATPWPLSADAWQIPARHSIYVRLDRCAARQTPRQMLHVAILRVYGSGIGSANLSTGFDGWWSGEGLVRGRWPHGAHTGSLPMADGASNGAPPPVPWGFRSCESNLRFPIAAWLISPRAAVLCRALGGTDA